MQSQIRNKQTVMSILICAFLFSLFTVSVQVRTLKLPYITQGGEQVRRHNKIIQNESTNPWQYRVLSEYFIEGIVKVFKKLIIPYPYRNTFIFFRVLQNLLIFLLAYLYYEKLGLTTYLTLIGLSLLAWGMSNALHDSDLSFNTYSDIIGYLLAGLVLLHGKYTWIIPITVLSALNRETSGLIPVMLFAYCLYVNPKNNDSKKNILIGAISLLLYTLIFLGIRHIYGIRPVLGASRNQIKIGLEMLYYNIGRYITWKELFGVLGILPIMAIYSINKWPQALKTFFWAIVPFWFAIHIFTSIMAEARLLLVPQALVFIPGALFGVANGNKKSIPKISPIP